MNKLFMNNGKVDGFAVAEAAFTAGMECFETMLYIISDYGVQTSILRDMRDSIIGRNILNICAK